MNTYIDAGAQRVVQGDRSWPFEIDFRAKCVRIQIDDRDYRISTLRWREKRMLSRFASIGEEALKREFVRLCLGNVKAQSPEDDDVLFQLARWFQAPGSERELSFDPVILSRVTLELCRHLRLAPEQLDDCDASELELLWRTAVGEGVPQGDFSPRSVMGHGQSPLPESAETTRIIVLPDPPAQDESLNTSPADDATPPAMERRDSEQETPNELTMPVQSEHQLNTGDEVLLSGRDRESSRQKHRLRSTFRVLALECRAPRRISRPDSISAETRNSELAEANEPVSPLMQDSPVQPYVDDARQPNREQEPTILQQDSFWAIAPNHASTATGARQAPVRNHAFPESGIDSRALLATLPPLVQAPPPTRTDSADWEEITSDSFADQLIAAAAELGMDVEA